jgi:hypothetical protein
MDSIGFDLGKLHSQICIITEDGELIERRLKTDRESLSQFFAGRAPARVLIETAPRASGSHATWKASATRWSWPTRTSPRCTPPAAAG